jgi:hypothetical protein
MVPDPVGSGILYYISYLFEGYPYQPEPNSHSLGQFGFKTNVWSFAN